MGRCLVVQQVGIKNVKACSHQRGRECFSKPVELSIRAAQRTELNQLMRVKTPSILFMYEHHRIGGLGQYEDDSLTTLTEEYAYSLQCLPLPYINFRELSTLTNFYQKIKHLMFSLTLSRSCN